MLTADAKAKKVKTAQDRLDRLLEKRTNLLADVEKVDREIRLATLDWEHRKAAPTVEDADDADEVVSTGILEAESETGPAPTGRTLGPPVYPAES